MSRLTRISLMLALFFGLDKGLALLRQVIIARQFGLSHELDAFNVANNIPDLLFALISGGALAMAFIPVLTATLTQKGRSDAWRLFSHVANLAFLVTAILAVGVALFAGQMVRSQVGIAPGFGPEQQMLVTDLMRLNLVATIIFSISGLVMAGLQANQIFIYSAMAPLLYNVGQIFGALILSPEKGIVLGPITLPAFGMGVHGLVAGVIIGAVLHLGIQIPGLVRSGFRWSFGLGLREPDVRAVLGLMGPRLITMLFIQAIFLVRDNLASRLGEGAVTALTYGWMLQQVPETLIGTAIGTALLPTLSELAAREQNEELRDTIQRAVQVLSGITLPVAAVLAIGLPALAGSVFGFDARGTGMLSGALGGFLLGLLGHSLMEVASRSFYARQDAWTPLKTGALNLVIYIALGAALFRPLGVFGISLTDAIAFTSQAILLLFLLGKALPAPIRPGQAPLRGLAAAGLGALAAFAVITLLAGRSNLLAGLLALAAGAAAAVPLIWKDIRQLLKL